MEPTWVPVWNLPQLDTTHQFRCHKHMPTSLLIGALLFLVALAVVGWLLTRK